MSIKKGIFYVFIANLINMLISLFTGFILPKFLSIESYADIRLFQLYISYIGILHLGYADGMYLHNGGKSIENVDKKYTASEFKTFKLFQVIITIIGIIVALIVKNKMLLFCSLVILPINIGSFVKNFYQAIGEFKLYSKFTYLNTFLIFLCNIFLLFIIKTDYSTLYIISYIIVYLIYWIVIENRIYKLLNTKKSKLSLDILSKDIKDGFFLMIGSFCNIIFTTIDRIFVKYLLGTIQFAYYSFAVSVESLMSVFITPISTVLYNYLCKNKTIISVLKLKKVILVFGSLIILLIFPAKFIVENWLQKYNSALNVLFLLFASQFMTIIIRCIHTNLYKSLKKQNKYFIIMVTIVVISIILNGIFYFFINKSNELIALATLVTTIIWFIIGEVDFKQYRMKFCEYLYMVLVLISFLFCGYYFNSIIGLIIYLTFDFILIFIFMRDSFIYLIKEFRNVLNKLLKRKLEKTS